MPLLLKHFRTRWVLSTVRGFAAQSSPELDRSCLMSAWQVMCYGSLDKLTLNTDTYRPMVTGPKDVLVKVQAASLNPIDLLMLGGYGNVFLDAVRNLSCERKSTLPLTLGRDFAGEVVAKGNEARNVNVGDVVYGVIPPHLPGCHAEYAIADSDLVCRKPSHLSVEEASGILYSGMTAWSALKVTGDLFLGGANNTRVLVIGGSGGVGTIAVQLLKSWGAEVVTTCSPDAVPLLQSLCADIIIDYTKPESMNDIALAGKYDIILDASGKASSGTYVPLLRSWSNAKFITLKSPLLKNVDSSGLAQGMVQNFADIAAANVNSGALTKGTTVRWGYFLPLAAGVSEISQMVLEKRIKPTVEKVFPFEDMQGAFKRLEEGHIRGKVVVSMNAGQAK